MRSASLPSLSYAVACCCSIFVVACRSIALRDAFLNVHRFAAQSVTLPLGLSLHHACRPTLHSTNTRSSPTTASGTGPPAFARSLAASLCRAEQLSSRGGTRAGTGHRSHWSTRRGQADHAYSAVGRCSNMYASPSSVLTVRTRQCTTQQSQQRHAKPPANSCPTERCAATAKRNSEPSSERARRGQQTSVSAHTPERVRAASCRTRS
jgi:hypothetical protein